MIPHWEQNVLLLIDRTCKNKLESKDCLKIVICTKRYYFKTLFPERFSYTYIAFVIFLWFSQFWIIPSPFFLNPQGVWVNSLDAGHYRFFKRQLADANYFWLFLLKEQPEKGNWVPSPSLLIPIPPIPSLILLPNQTLILNLNANLQWAWLVHQWTGRERWSTRSRQQQSGRERTPATIPSWAYFVRSGKKHMILWGAHLNANNW